MIKRKYVNNEIDHNLQCEDYLERPRLNKLFKDAVNYPLIIVCAGSGYGKTYAVHSFLKKYNTDISQPEQRSQSEQRSQPKKNNSFISPANEKNTYTSWVQISERDNVPARFWESYTNQLSLHWPEFGTRLKEIGFPKTDEAFSKYSAIKHEVGALSGIHIRVFDDFHLLRNPDILRFFERSLNIYPPNMKIILISRTMPEMNLVGVMKRKNVFTIQEDALCFTEEEIEKYYNQIHLSVMSADIKNIYDDTQGWAFAVNLIAHSLAKKQKYERYALESQPSALTDGSPRECSPLEAMKKNIFRFIEAEISQTISEQLWRFLLRISLIDHLAAGFITLLAKENCGLISNGADCDSSSSNNSADKLIGELELLNAYIRYDFLMDSYVVHHLFLDYLRQKQEQILTEDDRKKTYHIAGLWCEENGYHMDSLLYFEKSDDYDAILRKVTSLDVQMPQDMAGYALEIFERMPDQVKESHPLFPSMLMKLKINLGQFIEAQIIAEKYAVYYEAKIETPERNRALSGIYVFWGLLRMKMSTYTDVYDFDIFYKKLNDYYSKNPFKLIGAYKTLTASAWASNVGTDRIGAMNEYIAAVSRMLSFLSPELIGFYDGLDDLLRGELCFYRRQFNYAEQYLKQSIAKTQKYDQYVTQNIALVYMMHIYFSNGDLEGATKTLKEMEAVSIKHIESTTLYDIACGFYHFALDNCEKIPEWLKGDFSPFTHPSFLENYANRIRARYHYQTHKYDALLAFIENTEKHPSILFGKIELKVLKALSLYRQKKRNEAISVFTEAYNLADSNKLVASFTEYGKEMRTLSLAARKEKNCAIPKKWLEEVNRISSIYAKRKIKMISEYLQAEAVRVNFGHKLT